jgi:hypothetical protein
MGGNSGTIIIDDAMKQVLTNPQIHGVLPPKTRAVVDPILAREPGTWTADEGAAIFRAFTWAHTNI